MRWKLRASALLALFAASMIVSPAAAGPEQDKAQARQLAIDGVKAFEAGDFKAAVARFEAAEKLFHAPTHLLYVARGQAKLGQLVAARDTYLRIEQEVLGEGASPAFKKAQLDAAEERAQLEAKIPTLVVRIEPKDLTGVDVFLDGKRVEGSELGGALVDPGKHRVEAKTDDRSAEPIDIEVVLGEKREIVLDFGASAPSPSPATPPVAPPPPDAGGPGTMTILGISALGVGAVGLGVGVVLTIVGAGKGSDADTLYDQCGGDACPTDSPDAEEVRALDADAATFGTLGVLGLGLGAAFAATGVVFLVVGDGDGQPHEARLEVAPSLGGGLVRGRF